MLWLPISFGWVINYWVKGVLPYNILFGCFNPNKYLKLSVNHYLRIFRIVELPIPSLSRSCPWPVLSRPQKGMGTDTIFTLWSTQPPTTRKLLRTLRTYPPYSLPLPLLLPLWARPLRNLSCLSLITLDHRAIYTKILSSDLIKNLFNCLIEAVTQ